MKDLAQWADKVNEILVWNKYSFLSIFSFENKKNSTDGSWWRN